MEKHMQDRISLLDEIKPVNKKEWKKWSKASAEIIMSTTVSGTLPKDKLTSSQTVPVVGDEVPHRAYTVAMGRKAHRYACLKAAQSVGEIDWKYTENDWTVLKAGDTGETMLVSVRMAIPKTEYERMKRQYIRAQMMRAAKKGGK